MGSSVFIAEKLYGEIKMKTYEKLAYATLVSLIPLFIAMVFWYFYPMLGYLVLVSFIIFVLLGLGVCAEGEKERKPPFYYRRNKMKKEFEKRYIGCRSIECQQCKYYIKFLTVMTMQGICWNTGNTFIRKYEEK